MDLAAIDMVAAWMAKRGEAHASWISTLSIDSSPWSQYLAAAWEIGRGEVLPSHPELASCRHAGCRIDDPVFDFHKPDERLDRRGFLFPSAPANKFFPFFRAFVSEF